jgi:hypothetical protein
MAEGTHYIGGASGGVGELGRKSVDSEGLQLLWFSCWVVSLGLFQKPKQNECI